VRTTPITNSSGTATRTERTASGNMHLQHAPEPSNDYRIDELEPSVAYRIDEPTSPPFYSGNDRRQSPGVATSTATSPPFYRGNGRRQLQEYKESTSEESPQPTVWQSVGVQ
jgi:hypothetical protein